MSYGGGKTWGGSGKCRAVYFGQSTGVLREVERRFHSFRITHHRIFTERLLCARHRSKHGDAAVSTNPQTPVLMVERR